MNPRPPDSATVADRLSQLEDELRTLKRERNNRRKLGLVALGALGCMVTIGTAFAATGACPNAMPFCFAANQPATASEVNHNFAQLKEWLEAKVGAVATPVAITGPATFNAGVTAATVTTSGAGSVGSTLTVGSTATIGGQLTANGGLTVNGTVRETGYESSCFHGSAGFIYPGCCRINVRDGQTSCRVATNFQSTAWAASGPADPFSATTLGAYSLGCFDGISQENFPTCSRTDKVSGGVTCRAAINWQLSAWGATAAAF